VDVYSRRGTDPAAAVISIEESCFPHMVVNTVPLSASSDCLPKILLRPRYVPVYALIYVYESGLIL
jgi:hypothetical protein